VDADTRAPLDGVAVLAVWSRHVQGHPPIPLGFGEAGYFASDEALSGADGWFTIPSRVLFNPSLALKVVGPELSLFKAGYGGWRFGPGGVETLAAGGVIEMRPLRSREERLRYLAGRGGAGAAGGDGQPWRELEGPGNPTGIPYERAQRFEAAVNAERALVGLRPIGIGYPGLATEHARTTTLRGVEHVDLNGATAVARDRSGFLYVADTDHHRVVKLTPGLEVVGAWGQFGRADGQLQFPRGIAVDRSGTVYVADWGNHRVQAFAADGRFLAKWGELRYNELGTLFTPTDLAVTDAGEVVAYSGGRVFRFTSSGQLLGRWGKGQQFASRAGIGVDGQGHIYGISGDADPRRPRLRKFSPTGSELAGWGQSGSGPGQLFDPMGISVDTTGRVYVADADHSNPRVMVFAEDGRFLHQWDVKSGVARELRWPYGLAVDASGTVYVADMKHPRLHRLLPPGR
jgi:DNA-binding beta-propeller fold protein YncE